MLSVTGPSLLFLAAVPMDRVPGFLPLLAVFTPLSTSLDLAPSHLVLSPRPRHGLQEERDGVSADTTLWPSGALETLRPQAIVGVHDTPRVIVSLAHTTEHRDCSDDSSGYEGRTQQPHAS